MSWRNKTTRLILTATIVAAAGVSGSGCKKGSSGGGACVDVGGAACGACRDTTKEPFCAPHYVTPVASGNIKVNGQKGCCGFEDPTLRSNCENILRCIRSQNCADGHDPNKCLCGDNDLARCAAAPDWKGVCAPIYKTALEGGPPGKLIPLFGDPKSPIGIANNTFQCDVDSHCPCGGQKSP
ncbi:MAG TPA: hypothetical protein VKQ32_26180 [Polyangia bacterium]|nr:hypothetical protein [Polyangia bacterium]